MFNEIETVIAMKNANTGNLTFQSVVSTKGSYILKQICSFQLQVCLSMYDLLKDTDTKRLKKNQY